MTSLNHLSLVLLGDEILLFNNMFIFFKSLIYILNKVFHKIIFTFKNAQIHTIHNMMTTKKWYMIEYVLTEYITVNTKTNNNISIKQIGNTNVK